MILHLLNNEYSVYKFAPDSFVKENNFDGEFISFTKTKDEISVVAVSSSSNDYEKVESGWRILKIEGTLDFGLIGIVSKISTILAQEKISIFVISTYNTDYIMVKEAMIANAITALKDNHYEIEIH
jgi:hypothetical protein